MNGLLEKTEEETVSKFLGAITKNIEDSCVFVRHVILTLYNYPEEQAGRLKRLTDFYQAHKISLIKIIIENLKIEKLCDESNKTLFIFFYTQTSFLSQFSFSFYCYL